MAQDDLFVNEVNEDVRRDQMSNMLKKYRYVIGCVVVLVIGLVAGNEWRQGRLENAGVAQSQAIQAALAGDASAVDALATLDRPSALSTMMQAKLVHDAGENAAALAMYRDVQNDTANGFALRDLAALRAFAIDANDDGAVLMNPGAPYLADAKLVMIEKLVAIGDIESALQSAQELIQEPAAREFVPILETLILTWGGEIPEIDMLSAIQDEEEANNAQ